MRLVPEELARGSGVFPLCRTDGNLVVAVSDPLDPTPLERVRFAVQMPVIPVLAPREDIEQAIRTHYGGDAVVRETPPAPRPQRADPLTVETAPMEDASVATLVNRIIDEGYGSGASDIHIDASAGSQHVAVRFRRDGRLAEYVRLPAHLRAGIVTRIKAMAGIDISERRRAQEGRIDMIENGPAELQLRVITIPTRDGNEDIAIKIVPDRDLLPVEMLGLPDAARSGIEQLIQKAGLLLIAGPAASGRTTTAHALLTRVNVPGLKIWTVESPVEIPRPGFSQIEANEKIGWDFATIVRSVMHADPDVILIGELRRPRDCRPCRGSGPERLPRVFDAAWKQCGGGVRASGGHGRGCCTASRMRCSGVVSQRLARRLCSRCRISRPLDAAQTDALLEEVLPGNDATRRRCPHRLEGALRQRAADPWRHRLRSLRQHGLQGPHRTLRAHAGRTRHAGIALQRRPADELVAAGHAGRHANAEAGRHRESARRPL